MDETVHLEQDILLSASSLSSVLVLSGNVLTCEIFVQRLHCQPRTVRVQIIMPCLIAADGTNLFWHSVLRFKQRCIWRFCCSGLWCCFIMSERFEPM